MDLPTCKCSAYVSLLREYKTDWFTPWLNVFAEENKDLSNDMFVHYNITDVTKHCRIRKNREFQHYRLGNLPAFYPLDARDNLTIRIVDGHAEVPIELMDFTKRNRRNPNKNICYNDTLCSFIDDTHYKVCELGNLFLKLYYVSKNDAFKKSIQSCKASIITRKTCVDPSTRVTRLKKRKREYTDDLLSEFQSMICRVKKAHESGHVELDHKTKQMIQDLIK